MRWKNNLLLLACVFVAVGSPLAYAAGNGMHVIPERNEETVDHALAGRYSLGGADGWHAELRLAQEGTFEWEMSNGTLSVSAHGRWRQVRDRVELDVALPRLENGDLIQRKDAAPWDGNAEARLIQVELLEQEARIKRQCPFLERAVTEPVIASFSDSDTWDDRQRAADSAFVALRETIDALEPAVAEAVVPTAGQGEDSPFGNRAAQVVSDAMQRYQRANQVARDAYWRAYRDLSTLPQVRYPEACRLPASGIVRGGEPRTWRGGYAAVVADKGVNVFFAGIDVTFVFGDGVCIATKTGWDGWAGVRPRSAPLRAIILSSPLVRAEVFEFSSEEHQVAFFHLSWDLLGARWLDRMKIRVEDDHTLVMFDSDGKERGRYRRD